jgi:hypothetical protein
VLTILVNAAPFNPYLGISTAFNAKFIAVVVMIILRKTRSFPVIKRMSPTDPDIAFMNCPKANMRKARVPT